MINAAVLQRVDLGTQQLLLYVPEPRLLKDHYQEIKKNNPSAAFPYWAQVWPAAIGLCQFLLRHVQYLQDKKILELAAGLGLPSLLAAHYAREVLASDHIPGAVALMRYSVQHNGIKNMQCDLLDWNDLPATLKADTLLLSDINYAPAVFDEVYSIIQRFLNDGTTIILSTPQRLMAKPFIDRIYPYCILQEEVLVEKTGQPSFITVFVLQNPAILPAE